MMMNLDPQAALPIALVAIPAITFLVVGVKTLLSDRRAYDHARALTQSAEKAALGIISPETAGELTLDVERGFAITYVDGRPVIVPNGKLPLEKLA